MHYRKKPIIIQAYRFNGDVIDFYANKPSWLDESKIRTVVLEDIYNIEIDTLEGKMLASQGDWIIRGIEGELYPCKDSIFQASYEPVGD